jgi:hypothetical protein
MNWTTKSGRWNDEGFAEYLNKTSGLPFLEELASDARIDPRFITAEEAVELAYMRGKRVVMAVMMQVFFVDSAESEEEREQAYEVFKKFYGDICFSEYSGLLAYVREQLKDARLDPQGSYFGFDALMKDDPVSPWHVDGVWKDR